jgi:hypothetical protein
MGAGSDSATMSMRQKFMMGVLAVTLVAMLGATAAKDVTAMTARDHTAVWLDPSASDQLLASRLNITNMAKTPAP